MAVRFIWASPLCHSVDSEIVRDFRVDLVSTVMSAFDNSIVDSMEGSVECLIVCLIVGLIVGSVFRTLGSQLSLFLFLPCSIVDDRNAVTETMIYRRFIRVHTRVQDNGEDMEHFWFQNIVVYPP